MSSRASLETGVLYCDDNWRRLAQLPGECVDLIYLDPPFFSNKHYEVIWGDEAEVRSFDDRWEGGIEHYVGWMRDRLMEMHRVLAPNGTIYLHCDWRASHYLKLELDRIFGRRNFLNEIIWCYDTGGRATTAFPRKHDTIFRYGKTRRAAFYYDQVALPRDPTTMHESVFTDDQGRRYQRNIKGGKEYRYYLDKGVLPNDWWTDIQALNPAAKERLGYPTQKPEELLQRIISASSRRGDTVLDPFCGCGTTVAVAEKLGRRWVGVDISPQAVEVMRLRLGRLGVTPRIVGLPTTIDALRPMDHFDFQHWIIQRVLGTQSPRKARDGGIDGYSFFEHLPIQVKQSEHVGRKVVDEFETAIERSGKHMGYVIAFSFTRDAYEEAARSKRGRTAVTLVKVEDVLRVGELIEAADRLHLPPDLSKLTPDLMGLFGALQRAAEERPFSDAPAVEAKPSGPELISSLRRRRGVTPSRS